MSNIVKIIGERIRKYRNELGLTQEELAENAGLHNTYIGQLERGEKNATIESIEKVVSALDISFEILFEKLGDRKPGMSISLECYDIIDGLTKNEQKAILELIKKTIAYKHID